MADGYFNQQSGGWPSEIFSPITEPSLWFEIPFDSLDMHQAEVESIEDIFHTLSNVELCSEQPLPPPPPPTTTEVISTTKKGESSGAHRRSLIMQSYTVSNQLIEREEERNLKAHNLSERVTDLTDREEKGKRDQDDQQNTQRKRRKNELHNNAEKRRRNRIAEKIRTLQECIPNCNKRDEASVLRYAAEYGKSLQQQVQMMYMYQNMREQYYSSLVPMRPMMGMGHGMGMMAYPTNFQIAPTSGLNPLGESGFQPAVSQSQALQHLAKESQLPTCSENWC